MRAFYPLFIGLFKLFLKSRRKHDLRNEKLICKIRAVSPDVADPHGLQRARRASEGKGSMRDRQTKTKPPQDRRKGRRVAPAVVRLEIRTPERVADYRGVNLREVRRTLAQCADEMERGRTRFTIACKPELINAVRAYLEKTWGEYSPEVKQALVITARREPVKAGKGGAR